MRYFLTTLYSLVLLTMIIGCGDDDTELNPSDPNPISDDNPETVEISIDLVRFRYDSNTLVSPNTRYLVASDMTGKILSTSPLKQEAGEIQLIANDSVNSNIINLSIIYQDESGYSHVNTYAEVPINSSLFLQNFTVKNATNDSPLVIFYVDGLPDELKDNVFTSIANSNQFFARPQTPEGAPFLYRLTIPHSNSDGYLMIQNTDEPVYYPFAQINGGDTLRLTYPEDFTSFTEVIDVVNPLPGKISNLDIRGFNPADSLDKYFRRFRGYPLYNGNILDRNSPLSTELIRIGLLDYENYSIRFKGFFDNSNQVGIVLKEVVKASRPSQEDFNFKGLNTSLTINTSSLTNFSYNFSSAEFTTLERGYLSNSGNGTWRVFEPINRVEENAYLTEVPTAIANEALNELIIMNNMSLQSTVFIDVGSDGYTSFLNYTLGTSKEAVYSFEVVAF